MELDTVRVRRKTLPCPNAQVVHEVRISDKLRFTRYSYMMPYSIIL